MSDVDDFVFQYLLTLNRSYWQFRHQPRNAQIEQEIIKLGQREFAIEHNPEFQKTMSHTLRPFSNSVWNQLDLGELKNELRRFSIVSPEILEKFPDVGSADISLEIQLIPEPVDRFNVYEHLYFFQRTEQPIIGEFYTENKKIQNCSSRFAPGEIIGIHFGRKKFH